GIFIDPEEAVTALQSAGVGSEPVYLATTDVWDSRSGIERRAPAAFRAPRQEYIRDASLRMEPRVTAMYAAEPPAACDLPRRLVTCFNAALLEACSIARVAATHH